MHRARHALARKRHGIELRHALRDDAINRHLLARLHDDGRTDRHFSGRDLHEPALPLDIGVVRADIHEACDVATALAHSIGLEQLPHLIEEHDRDGLIVVAVLIDGQHQRAEGCHGHEQVFIKGFPLHEPFRRLPQHAIAHEQIRYEIGQEARHTMQRQLADDEQQHGCQQDTDKFFLLFPIHAIISS